MNKENERITYEEFMTMFKFAPKMCYTLYDKAEDEIDKLKKQKDDVVKVLKALKYRILYEEDFRIDDYIDDDFIDVLLRMLGEIDVED